MTSSIFKILLVSLFVSFALSNCAALCSTCNADGVTCQACVRGYRLESNGSCELPNTAGIIAGAVIGGAILFAIVIIFLCACINGWGRVFRYPHPHDQISNNINSYPNVMITEQQLNTTVTYDPVQTSYLPQPILRNGTAMAQPTLNPTKITLAEALSGDQNQAARIMKPNPTDICVVCMGPQVNVLVLPCNHQLHYGCLANWFNRQTTCPKCHGNVSSVKVQCNSCANYNDSVSFCPPGCPNPNHKQCFVRLNKDRLACRKCNKMRKSTRLSQVKNSNPHRISKASTQSNLARSTSQIYPSAITMTQLGSANTLVSGIYGMSTIR